MIEFEKFEQELEQEFKEDLEQENEANALNNLEKADEGGVKVEKLQKKRKRNIEGMIEKLKRLQRALKESQKMYLAEQGKVVLRWYQDYKQNKVGVNELEEQLKETAELFGKDLNEVIE
jgi:hypothetical protein